MILSTNNQSLMDACPYLRSHGVIYQHDLYGSSEGGTPMTEWPHHNRPPMVNVIEVSKRSVGRTLIDLERKGKARTNASGFDQDIRGDWDFTTTQDWPNPEQRRKDVEAYHVDLYQTLHELSPTIDIGWWMTPRDDYYSYRDYIFGNTEKVDHYRAVAAEVSEGPSIMDFAAVVHYVHQDEIGETINGVPLTWQHRADILNAKIETAKQLGVPIVVYVNPDGMSAVDTETYLQQVSDRSDVDECVVWLPSNSTYTTDDPIVEGIKFHIHTRLK